VSAPDSYLTLASLTRDLLQQMIGHGMTEQDSPRWNEVGDGLVDFIRTVLRWRASPPSGAARPACRPRAGRYADSQRADRQLNPRQPSAEALAIKGDRILAVGSESSFLT
jgi:hypothetical protein